MTGGPKTVNSSGMADCDAVKKLQQPRKASKVWVKKDKSEEEHASAANTHASCKGTYSETADFPIYSRNALLKFLSAKSASRISTASTSATDSDESLSSGEDPEDKILHVTVASAPLEPAIGNGRGPGARRALKALKKARTPSDLSTGKAEVDEDTLPSETGARKKSKGNKSKSQSDSTSSSPYVTSSAASPYIGASPAFMSMMLPMPMTPYELPGLHEQVEDGLAGSLRAEAPEFVPGSQPTTVSMSAGSTGPDIAAVIREARVAAQTHQATLNALTARNLAVFGLVDSEPTQQTHTNDKDDEETKVRKQIEYYFSVGNICHDVYLRSLMDENGWVKLEDLVRFPRLCALTSDAAVAASAVAASAQLEVDTSERRVRIKKKSLRAAFPQAHEGTHRGAMLGLAAEGGKDDKDNCGNEAGNKSVLES